MLNASYRFEQDRQPCTTDDEARAALDAAKREMAAHGLDAGVRTPLVPVVDGVLTVGARTVRVEEVAGALPDHEALRAADTLAGGFVPSVYGPRVVGYRVTVDGVEVQRAFVRSDPACAGRHDVSVAGAIVQGERVALVWTGVHGNCKATVPFVLVGPVW